MTTSIEDAFGSRLMVRGFMLNNQLTDFSFVSNDNGRPVANRVQAGKRPRSAMSPELVFDKKTKQVTMIVGSAGGPAIINHVAKTLVGVLDWGMTMQQAIALPNFGSMNGPTQLERGRVSEALADGLKGRGHDVQVVEMNSGLQGIQRLNAGADGVVRRRGSAAGRVALGNEGSQAWRRARYAMSSGRPAVTTR